MLALTPLAGPECRWAVSKTWVFVVRSTAAVLVLGILLVVAWYCWLVQTVNPAARPEAALGGALLTALGLNFTLVLLLAPALLAGAFSSDATRTALGILLITEVSAGEIVLSRLISRVSQVAIVAAAGLPGICFLCGYCGAQAPEILASIATTLAIACGASGIALLLSVLFTRARDALIGTYGIGLLLLVAPSILAGILPPSILGWIMGLNPYLCLDPLVSFGYSTPALRTAIVWAALGVVGAAATTWLLWPSYLRRTGGKDNLISRRDNVPPVSEDPIGWKELNIESNKQFGKLLSLVSRLTLIAMLGGSALLTVLFLWSNQPGSTPTWVDGLLAVASSWIEMLSLPMSWLLQWGVGIRAAAGISTEKEQGTWEALMMTPLEGREIVRAKIYVGYYSLRWYLVATLIVWLLGVMLGSITAYDFAMLLMSTAFFVGLTSALGVWSSLSTKTSGRAITLTLFEWLVAKIVILIASLILIGVVMLFLFLCLTVLGSLSGNSTLNNFQPPMSMETAMVLMESALCLVSTLLIAWHCGKKFDRLAGRGYPRPKPVFLTVH